MSAFEIELAPTGSPRDPKKPGSVGNPIFETDDGSTSADTFVIIEEDDEPSGTLSVGKESARDIFERSKKATFGLSQTVFEGNLLDFRGPSLEWTAQDIADVRHAFATGDTNDNGAIDMEEFARLLLLWGMKDEALLHCHPIEAENRRLELSMELNLIAKDLEPIANEDFLLKAIAWDVSLDPPVTFQDQTWTDLTFPEFLRLVLSGELDKHVRSWHVGTQHFRLFKFAFDTADQDQDLAVEKKELQGAINSLHAGDAIVAENFDKLWEVIAQGKDAVDFVHFVDGMALVRDDPNLSTIFKVTEINPLTGIAFDVPVPPWEERMVRNHMGILEKFGFGILMRIKREPNSRERTNDLLEQAKQGTMHVLDDVQLEALSSLQRTAVWNAAHIGFWTSLVCVVCEVLCIHFFESDGFSDQRDSCLTNESSCLAFGCAEGGTCSQAAEDDLLARASSFWLYAGLALVVTVAIELTLLYVYSTRNCVRVAGAMGWTLIPMNRERANVVTGLLRAALEIPQPNEVLHGTDPLREVNSASAVLVMIGMILYKAKVAMSNFIAKVILKRLLARTSTKLALPWVVVPVTTLWDVFVAELSFTEAKLRATGMATGIEIFNEIIAEHREGLTETGRLQVCRAIGCNIVKCRNMYPSNEMLLKHAQVYLGIDDQFKGANNISGRVDVAEFFLQDMESLNNGEKKAVLEVLVLATIMDGQFRKREKQLLVAATHAAGFQNRCWSETPMRVLAQKIRRFKTLSKADIQGIYALEEPTDKPSDFIRQEVSNKLMSLCAC